MNNWQPINTAPKDRRILLRYKYPYAFIGKYKSDYIAWVSDDGRLLKEEPIAWQELPVFDGEVK